MLADLKYALRQIRLSPGFSLVAILTLAVGLGANAAIFSMIEATVLRALPAKDPAQLVTLWWDTKLWPPRSGSTGGDPAYLFSYPEFQELRQSGALESAFAFVPLGFTAQNTTVNLGGEVSSANGLMVTGDYFSGLGVNPLLGRVLGPADEEKGAPRVVVLSYGYWVRQFNRDSGAIGRTVKINDVPFTVAGVASPGFQGVMQPGGSDPDLWVAFAELPTIRPYGLGKDPGTSAYTLPRWFFLNVVGRLKPAMSRAEAESRLDVVFRRYLAADWKDARPEQIPHLRLIDAGRGLVGLRDALAPSLAVLTAGGGLLLLVVCSNLATLLLARAAARQREIGIRLAIGASRWRLIRQLLVESCLMAALGGALGLLIAQAGIEALTAMLGKAQPLGVVISLDPSVLAFTAVLTLLTGVIFGLAPALRASRADLAGAMKQSSGASRGPQGQRLGQALIVAQVAASAALLIAAGLFVRTLRAAAQRELGFNQSQLIVFGLDPTRKGYSGERLINFYAQLRRDLLARPGIRSATLLEDLPYNGSNNSDFALVGSGQKVPHPIVRWYTVGPDFCQTLQTTLVKGRDIRESDGPGAPAVGLVNQSFVERFCGGLDPIGRQFTGPDGKRPFEIVGVIKDIELEDLRSPPMPKALVPYAQIPSQLDTMYFEVRTQGDSAAAMAGIRAAVHQADPGLPLLNLSTQSGRVEAALLEERVLAQAASFFGIAALVLACIGLYGTMAYTVARRTREIGIRVALGSSPRRILRLILGQGFGLILLGSLIGLGASFGLNHAIRGLFYGVTENDPATFILAGASLLLVTLGACYLPARRATRVDPIVALRTE